MASLRLLANRRLQEDTSLDLLFAALAILGGFVTLVWGADRFVIGAAATAKNLGVSPLIIGLTIVAFGTSAPEMLVSGMAAWTGNPGLAIGNAVGSNVTNVGLVLGLAALVRPLSVHSKILRRELPVLLVTMAIALGLMWDGELGRIDGLILLGGFVGMVAWVVREGLAERKKAEHDALTDEFEQELPRRMTTGRAMLWLALGLVVLLGSSRLLVWGAVTVASFFGVSDMVIGLTVVAIGTSLPELAASMAAAIKDEHDIAIGNVVGSNMFNLLGVLCLPGLISPGPVDESCVQRDFPVMFAVTILLLAMARGLRSESRVSRLAGGVLLTCYLAYLVLLYVEAGVG